MTARPGGPGRLRLTFAAADGQIPPFPRRRTPSAFHWSQFGRLHLDRALLQSVICAFLMGLVKTPCFAIFPSLHAGAFIGLHRLHRRDHQLRAGADFCNAAVKPERGPLA